MVEAIEIIWGKLSVQEQRQFENNINLPNAFIVKI